jgi:YCII-related domain
MRFMILIKATKDSEAGVMPSERLLTEMGNFNEELVKAGVMLAAQGGERAVLRALRQRVRSANRHGRNGDLDSARCVKRRHFTCGPVSEMLINDGSRCRFGSTRLEKTPEVNLLDSNQ